VVLIVAPLSLYPVLRPSNETVVLPPPEPPKPVEVDQKKAFEELAKKDPLEFLERCLSNYEKEVPTGYTCIFDKQERVKGKLRDKESIQVYFREKPFSVRMDWIKGNDFFLGAQKSLYVAGVTDGFLYARPSLPGLPVLPRQLTDPQVLATSRFPITEFGMQKGAIGTVNAMRKAKERNELHVKYEGIVELKEAGNRPCYKVVRTPYNPPEEDGCNELVIFIDVDSKLQVGSILRDRDNKLIAEYFFYNIDTNATLTDEQFSRDAI
jgi:hypothetical protein